MPNVTTGFELLAQFGSEIETEFLACLESTAATEATTAKTTTTAATEATVTDVVGTRHK